MKVRVTIGRKLVAFGAFAVLLCLAIGTAGYWGMSRVDSAMDSIVVSAMAQRNHMTADMMHDALRATVLDALVAAEQQDADAEKRVRADLAEYAKAFRKSVADNQALSLPDEVKKAILAAAPALNEYIQQAEANAALAFENRRAALEHLHGFQAAFKRLEGDMEQVGGLIDAGTAATQQAGDGAVEWAKWCMGGTALLAVLLMLAGSLAITRSITRPLQATTRMIQDIAEGEGDLTKRLDVQSQDELGEMARWFNTFVSKIHDIVGQVRGVAEQLGPAAQQLAAGSEQLSSGAQEQASSLEETAASLEEMTGAVKQNAENARQANHLAAGARGGAENGGTVVTDAVAAMAEITRSSKRIAEIITTIDEIAFQTNLLALNAAVEAARAGEQGRGFAVVASEVRALAQRSAAASKEIKALITDSVGKVDEGSTLVTRSGQTLTEIVTSVKKVADLVAEISAASQEQSQGIEQVNKAVTQMDTVTQGTAAQTEEFSGTASSLAAQAVELQALVGKFKLATES